MVHDVAGHQEFVSRRTQRMAYKGIVAVFAAVGKKLVSGRSAFASSVAILFILACRLWQTRRRPRGVVFIRHWLWGSPLEELLDVFRAFCRNEHLEWLWGLHWQFGRTFAFKPPFKPWTVMTTCPKNVQHILSTNFQNYPKGAWVLGRLSDLLGRGIFNVDGDEWFHQRKTANQIFSAKLFEEHTWVVVHRNARKLRDTLLTTDARQPIDIFSLMNRFTLDTIGEIGFGKCIGSLDDPSSPFLQCFDKAQRIICTRFFPPHWRLLRLLGKGSERHSYEVFGHLDDYTKSVVRDLHRSIAREDDSAKSSGISWADIEARKSLVGLFLVEARNRGETLSENYLRDLVLNFLIAGRDTTAHALSWTVYCLCNHPEVAAKARAEICGVCGVRGPVYEDLHRLTYLQAVLNEALRLYPSIPLEPKAAADDDTWPDGTFVPRGTVVWVNVYAMGRDPSIWGEDAETFRPERWLEMEAPPSSFEYPVFHAGPRQCLGKRLAQIEMHTCLAMLLPQLSFRLAVPADKVTHDGTLTIGMVQGLPCFVERLESKKHADSSSSTVAQSESECTVSDYTSACSECSDAASEAQKSDGAGELTHEEHGAPGDRSQRKGRRTSGRARQREKRRIRVTTPSPERFLYL